MRNGGGSGFADVSKCVHSCMTSRIFGYHYFDECRNRIGCVRPDLTESASEIPLMKMVVQRFVRLDHGRNNGRCGRPDFAEVVNRIHGAMGDGLVESSGQYIEKVAAAAAVHLCSNKTPVVSGEVL